MKKMVCTLFAAVLLLADAPPAPETLPRVLTRVLRAGPEEFKPIRGARIDIRPGRESWFDARVNLPGASCRVYEHPRPEYRCRWERSPERRDLAALQKSLAGEVETALGEGWNRSEANGALRFTRERDGATVLIARPAPAWIELAVAMGDRR